MEVTPVEAQLVLHEGLRLVPYLDTEDNWTVGVGYNLTGRGAEFLEQVIGRKFLWREPGAKLTRAEALQVLHADVERLQKALPLYWPYYKKLSDVRKRVALDMAFNMGFKALGFKNTIKYVEESQWSKASMELYKSKWARQVGDGPGGRRDRCDRLSGMLLTGNAPTDVPAVAPY